MGAGLRRRLGEGVGAVHEIVVGDDLPDEAHLLGAFGVDAFAEEEKLHGVLPADSLGHADGALDGGDADGDFGEAELGAVTGDDEVTGGDEGEGEAEAVAVDGGDDRFPDFEAAFEGVEAGPFPVAGRVEGGGVAEVGAGAEGAAGTGDDGDVGVFVVAECEPGGVEGRVGVRR